MFAKEEAEVEEACLSHLKRENTRVRVRVKVKCRKVGMAAKETLFCS